jgi:hypothetical protein
MKKINKEWREKHPMPKNATDAQRFRWHLVHAKMCGCRPIPASLARKLKNK